IDVEPAREPGRRVAGGRAVDPCPRDRRWVARIRVVRHEDAPGRRGRPERPVVRAVTREPRERAAAAVGPVDGAGQVARLVDAGRDRGRRREAVAVGAAERPVVATALLVAAGHELRTVRLVAGDVRGRVLWYVAGETGPEGPGPPDVLRARVDRVRDVP